MNKKHATTYDEFVTSLTAEEKAEMDRDYTELVLSELLIALMQENKVSARKLAQQAGISPTIIQEIKSCKRPGVSYVTVSKILNALGYTLTVTPLSTSTEDI